MADPPTPTVLLDPASLTQSRGYRLFPDLTTTWMLRYRDLQSSIDRGELGDPVSHLAEMEASVESLAIEGLDFAEMARCLVHVARAQIYLLERSYKDAARELELAQPKLPLSRPAHVTVEGNRLLHWGNWALCQDQIREAAPYYEQASQLATLLYPNLKANAEFNLGNCLRILGQFGTAEAAFMRAGEAYLRAGLPEKLPDVYHQLGNLANLAGDLEKAGGYIQKAMELYLASTPPDTAGAFRTADDFARVLLLKSQKSQAAGKTDAADWCQLALDFSLRASFAAGIVWKSSGFSEGRMADLSVEAGNHIVTLSEAALSVGNVGAFLWWPGTKQGTHPSDDGRPTPNRTPRHARSPRRRGRERRAERAAGGSSSRDGALHKGDEVVAVVDHIVIHGTKQLIGVYICKPTGRGGQNRLARTELPGSRFPRPIEWACAVIPDAQKRQPSHWNLYGWSEVTRIDAVCCLAGNPTSRTLPNGPNLRNGTMSLASSESAR